MIPDCKEVSTAFARGEYASASIFTKLRLQLHLAICRHCRRFKRQMELIEQALKTYAFPTPGPAAVAALEHASLKRMEHL